MMDVDDALRVSADKLVREYLHVARENDEIGIMLLEQVEDLLLGDLLLLFHYRNSLERYPVEIRNGFVVGMIRNDERNFAGEFATAVSIEKIGEAMIVFGNQDGHSGSTRGLGQPPCHVEAFRDRVEVAGKISQVDVEIRGIEFHPHQKQIRTFIGVLVGMQDVPVVAIDEVGDSRHNTFLIGTAEQKDGGAF